MSMNITGKDTIRLAKEYGNKYGGQGILFQPMSIKSENDGLLIAFAGTAKPNHLPAPVQNLISRDPEAQWEFEESDGFWLIAVMVG